MAVATGNERVGRASGHKGHQGRPERPAGGSSGHQRPLGPAGAAGGFQACPTTRRLAPTVLTVLLAWAVRLGHPRHIRLDVL
jgi:hypothetical protein